MRSKEMPSVKPGNHLKLEASGFLETLLVILVFVGENCCLCICFTELSFFY